jgi:hypothetical protein
MKKLAKEKKQKLIHLMEPVIVSTRKNDSIPFLEMLISYLKIIKKDGVKKEENVHAMFYEINRLR